MVTNRLITVIKFDKLSIILIVIKKSLMLDMYKATNSALVYLSLGYIIVVGGILIVKTVIKRAC